MNKLVLILAPIISGIAAAALRYTTIINSVNAETGIPADKNAIYILFGAIIAISIAFLLISIFKFKNTEISAIEKDTTGYKFIAVMAALLFFGSAAMSFFNIAKEGTSFLLIITAIFALVCGISSLGGVKFRNNREFAAFFSVIPIFFSAYTLLMFYRGNNSNPLIYSFALEIFALVFSMFSFYSISAAFFGKNHPRRIAFFSLTSIFLLTTVLLSDGFLPGLTRGHVHFGIADILTMCAFLLCNICNLITISKKQITE